MTSPDLSAVFALPMPIEQAAIDRWVGVVIAQTDQPARRAEALIELQDRQAMHAAPFSPLVVRAVGEWLERAWCDAPDFVDAAATLALNLGVGRHLLERTCDHGSTATRAIAQEALEEWGG